VAASAMLMAVFGDFFAALMGKFLGKTKIYKSKTFVGTFSCFIANLGVAYLVLPGMHLINIPMAIVATVVELFSSKIDDNLSVPIFAGFVGQIIVYYFAIHLPAMQFTIPALF
jgi:dolichol kinase